MLRFRTLLLLALPFLCVGCSGRVATYPVSGTVHFDDGQPVRVGAVEFRCQETGLSARAKLNDTGSFSLGTFADIDGAPAGTYKIIVVQFFDAPPRKHVHTHADHAADEHDDHEHAAHDSQAHEPECPRRAEIQRLLDIAAPRDSNFGRRKQVRPRRQPLFKQRAQASAAKQQIAR
jgi:hypothetical protein